MSNPIIETLPAEFGAPYESGFYAGCVKINGQPHAVAVAPKAVGELKTSWGGTYEDIAGADSYFDSATNTQAMAAAGIEVAQQVQALAIGGVTGWCIPARDVLELCYRNLKPTTEENYAYRSGDNPSSVPPGYPYTETLPAQTTTTAFQEGGAEAFEGELYWSSTQVSDDGAWIQDFGNGFQLSNAKSSEARVRAVRLIQLNA